MPRAMHACSTPGCGELTTRAGRCTDCKTQAEQRRGSASSRGYDHKHRKVFRTQVLKDQAVCQCPPDHHTHDGQSCPEASVHADHKRDRRNLVREGLDPNDPRWGRGLCHSCHSYRTTQTQPGGWHTG